MADQEELLDIQDDEMGFEECVGILLSLVSNIMLLTSMISQILASLLIQQRMQQNVMFGQTAMKGNRFVLRAKRKWTLTGRVRSCWKKPGRTEQWWSHLLQGCLLEEEWNVNLRMCRDDFMNLVKELQPYIEPGDGSPNWIALSSEKKTSYYFVLLKGYRVHSHDCKFVWCC